MSALSMKRAARPLNYFSIQRATRPVLQYGARVCANTIAGGSHNIIITNQQHIIDDNNRCTSYYHRSYSISLSSLASTYPATELISPTTSDAISTTTTKRLVRRKAGKKRNDINIKHFPIPKQSSHTTRIMFDTIAPHVESRTINVLTKQLSGIDWDSFPDDTEGKGIALEKMLDKLFVLSYGQMRRMNHNDSMKPEHSVPAEKFKYGWGLARHHWMRQTISDYFMGRKLAIPNQQDNPLPHKSDVTYPPNLNRNRHDKDLTTLIEAREVSLRHPIFWTEESRRESGYTSGLISNTRKTKKQEYEERITKQHASKSDGQLLLEAEELLEVLTSQLPYPQFDKLMGRLRRYVSTLDSIHDVMSPGESNITKDDTGNNSWYIDDDDDDRDKKSGIKKLSKSLPELPQSRATHADYKKHSIPVLGKFLKLCTGSHSHLIGYDMANYFYVDIPQPKSKKKYADTNADTEREAVDTPTSPERRIAFAIERQTQLSSIQKKYNKKKDVFVEKISRLQHEFASTQEERSGMKLPDDQPYNGNRSGSLQDLVDDDLLVDVFQKAQAKYSPESRKQQKEELGETLMDLRQLESGTSNQEDNGEKKRGRGRPKDVHLRFTAIKLEDKTEPPASDGELSSQTYTENELEEKIVFINNLPIDITEDEVDEIYSRCGPLDSIQLFNLRPDLDPGRLSQAKMEERRRNNARKRNSYSKNHRPRTPVYGMLRFETDKGYKVATSQELCIFGCVIRRHPVLTIKHNDMKTLHLEQLRGDEFPTDVENKLTQLLKPNKMSVMLDGMKGAGWNGDEVNDQFSKTTSCEVKFEDFHAAFQAYQLMQGGKDTDNGAVMGEGSLVQWFKTPTNSMDYWTRQLSF